MIEHTAKIDKDMLKEILRQHFDLPSEFKLVITGDSSGCLGTEHPGSLRLEWTKELVVKKKKTCRCTGRCRCGSRLCGGLDGPQAIQQRGNGEE